MDFTNILYSLPNSLLFVSIFLILSMVSALCLYRENHSIGYVGATIGVIYAVLAGFIILYVMDNFQKASDITRAEAVSAAKIYRNSVRLPLQEQYKIQMAVKQYVNTVINTEWPLFTRGKLSVAGEEILDKLTVDLSKYIPINEQDLLALRAIYTEIDDLYKDRDQRIALSNAALPAELWILLVISTILTLFVKSLTGMKFSLHIMLQIVVTLMLTAILFLIIVLDRPYRGHFSIDTQPFIKVLDDMKVTSENK
jgi:hypothetical protein